MQKFDYEVYTGNDLGAVYSPKMTRFKVWAPEAESVKLNLYKQGEGDNLIDQHIMKKSANVLTFLKNREIVMESTIPIQ